MKRNKLISLMLVPLIALMTAGCTKNTSPSENVTSDAVLKFNSNKYKSQSMKVDGKDVKYRAYENIVYVEHPVDTQYEVMNIYIPETYFYDGSVNNFTADTAPIFFPNNVGGYLPAEPGKPSMEGEISGDASREGMTSDDSTKNESPNSILMALSKGYVVASAGARGRTLEDKEGKNIGKAPAAIVDLKAAVRYLHYNDDNMAGNADKIISSGTSAGGAMSALLGATGNNEDYEPFLKEIGAADVKDNIYAVSAYCPIINLEHADVCYEWMFNIINDYTKMIITNENGEIKREKKNMTLTKEQQKYSDELKAAFPQYLNNLNLKDDSGIDLTVDDKGNGDFKDFLKLQIIKSAQEQIKSGKDLSQYKWLIIHDNVVTDMDFDGYISYLGRSKAAPAFDSVDLNNPNPENSLFGTKDKDNQHFTKFSEEKDTAGGKIADSKIIKMMNPLNYVGNSEADTAKYWRIRHGSKDSDTALCVPVILAQRLKNTGCDVDFEVPWDIGHGGDYDLEELFEWMEEAVKQ